MCYKVPVLFASRSPANFSAHSDRTTRDGRTRQGAICWLPGRRLPAAIYRECGGRGEERETRAVFQHERGGAVDIEYTNNWG